MEDIEKYKAMYKAKELKYKPLFEDELKCSTCQKYVFGGPLYFYHRYLCDKGINDLYCDEVKEQMKNLCEKMSEDCEKKYKNLIENLIPEKIVDQIEKQQLFLQTTT